MKRPAEAPTTAAATLSLLVDTLASVGVTAWLTDGTLLGAIRERKFIKHDTDMDVGAMITEYNARVLPALKAAGFTRLDTFGSKRRGFEHQLSRDDFKMDIFWHYDTPGGGVKHSAYDKRGEIEYHYTSLALAPLKFMGRTYWAPDPPRLHLVEKYGLDWRTPKTTWDYADDPVNARREP